MRKFIFVLVLALVSISLSAETIKKVNPQKNTVEVTFSQEKTRSLAIDDSVYLNSSEDSYSLKGIVRAVMKSSVVIYVEFGVDVLKRGDKVSLVQAEEKTVVTKKPDTQEAGGALSAKTNMAGFSVLYWMAGSVSFSAFNKSYEKESTVMFKYFYDKVAPDGGSFGFFAHFAPNVKFAGFDKSGTMMELGMSFKTRLATKGKAITVVGLNMGYRTVEASGMNSIQGFGTNVGLMIVPDPRNSKLTIEGGFLAQPTGGNNATSVTWGPIFYVGVGFLL